MSSVILEAIGRMGVVSWQEGLFLVRLVAPASCFPQLICMQPNPLCFAHFLVSLSGVTFWCHSLVNRLVSSARAKNGVRNVQHCSCIAMCNMPICTVGAWKSVNVHIVIYFWQPQLHCLFHCGLICGCETNSEEETNSLKKSEEKNP